MSWDIDRYREEHESEEHWQLRREFMERWKNEYSEERLVCLAQVFANIEFLGCRYPIETMQDIARLSHDIAKDYRSEKRSKLQRTFVSASDAAEDRAKGIKREGGVIKAAPNAKSQKIDFVKQGEIVDIQETSDEIIEVPGSDDEKHSENATINVTECSNEVDEKLCYKSNKVLSNRYLEEMSNMSCLNIELFRKSMFNTSFGKFVLIVRTWIPKINNIQYSCDSCKLRLDTQYEDNIMTLTLNGKQLAQASGSTKGSAKNNIEKVAWNRLIEESICLLIKERWIAQEDRQISMCDVSGRKASIETFGTPIESTVATKMMKLMGWKGGGLGANAQGIDEPIKPKLQMVNRAGLGSKSLNMSQLRRKGMELMKRFFASDELDVDLVFSNEFSSDERSVLHLCAKRAGLASKSYGAEAERFLVVKKKLDIFAKVEEVVAKGVGSSFIKPNNVPRVGRSNEADGPFDQGMMGYVIKTIPSKNIPRMGRRNFDSGSRYDIPKLYQLSSNDLQPYEDGSQDEQVRESLFETK
ncbi:unnamed protein product [Leptosia nina]|uniref:NF-kappa-B-repressing factor n=1 Tax=Leptosia nina TaxID=320188 RepID=A0AAV1JK84_9NEOP